MSKYTRSETLKCMKTSQLLALMCYTDTYSHHNSFLCLVEPPTIVKRSKDKVTVVEGNVLYLFCEAQGFPIPRVTWRKDGKLLQSSINDTDFIIHEARDTDAGNYECKATNSVGTVKYTVEVTIKGEVTISKFTVYIQLTNSLTPISVK